VTNVKRVDHLAIAVADLTPAVTLFQDVLGGQFILGGDDPKIHIRTAQFGLPGGMKIELISPTTADSYLQAFIDKHGQGFHHLTLMVDDVEVTIDDLTGSGFEVVNTDLSHPRWRESYLRPSFGMGLVQFADTIGDWSTPTTAYTLDDVLAGQVVWRDHTAVKEPS
jgi:methylmalonyl-CoA/ethylmalonyl-CoA epimerase